jgi:DDE superfamily endonuclease
LPGLLSEIAARHPEAAQVELWFEDEARVGQKGRTTHVWYQKGVRPRGRREQRFASAHLFGAVCPARDAGLALVLPEADTAAMNLFLAELSRTLKPTTHAVVMLDRAGWHVAGDLVVPANLTLLHLPSKSPELNPVEKVWQYLRERYLSHRVLADYEAIVDAACKAWNALTAEPGRLRSLTSVPWLPQAVSTS